MISFWNTNFFKDIGRWITKKREKTETKSELPTHSSLPILWNLVFCPHKVQNFQSLCGTFIIQILNGACIVTIKEKMAVVTWGGHKYFLIFHPDVAQEILKSTTVINKDWLYNILHPWLGTGLLTSSDDKWRNRRKLLTPAFHFRILEDFQDIFNEQSNILISKLKEKKDNEIFDMVEVVSFCTLDIIGDSAMGVHINAQNSHDSAYVQAINDVTASIIQWFIKPWYWFSPIFNLSSLGRKMKHDTQIIHQFDRQVIRDKKQKIIERLKDNQYLDNFQEDKESIGIKKRRAFLDLLLYHHLTHGTLNEEDIREEVDTFMFEGHDTTSMGIVWTLYLLGLHHDIQERVFQELEDIFYNDIERTIRTDDLKMMKYLECVIKESIRLYPSVPFIIRKNPTEMTIGEHILPANSSLVVCISAIHRNPSVFENPEVFNPDRFLPENSIKRHPFAFLPFSAGPRNCIGQKFAMMEMKTVIANIIRHLKIHSLDPRDKIYESGDIILRPKFGVRMTVEKRCS